MARSGTWEIKKKVTSGTRCPSPADGRKVGALGKTTEQVPAGSTWLHMAPFLGSTQVHSALYPSKCLHLWGLHTFICIIIYILSTNVSNCNKARRVGRESTEIGTGIGPGRSRGNRREACPARAGALLLLLGSTWPPAGKGPLSADSHLLKVKLWLNPARPSSLGSHRTKAEVAGNPGGGLSIQNKASECWESV